MNNIINRNIKRDLLCTVAESDPARREGRDADEDKPKRKGKW